MGSCVGTIIASWLSSQRPWQQSPERVRHNNAAEFYTDNGAPCPACSCTCYSYAIDGPSVRHLCFGCHLLDQFAQGTETLSKEVTAADISSAHRRS